MRRRAKASSSFPILMLIDGGQGQLNAALAAFATMAEQPPLVDGVGKKRGTHLGAGSWPSRFRLGRNHPALRLCQAIRDEAHRFAGHYHADAATQSGAGSCQIEAAS